MFFQNNVAEMERRKYYQWTEHDNNRETPCKKKVIRFPLAYVYIFMPSFCSH